MASITGLANINSADQTITDDLIVTDALTVNGNATIGNAATDTFGVYGATAVNQPASSDLAPLTNTALTALTTTPSSAAAATRVNQVIVDLAALQTKYNFLRSSLVSIGLISTS